MKRINEAIDQRERKSGNISTLLNIDMSRFKVYESPHLFDTNDELQLIKQGICPVCLCQLKVSKKGDIYCRSVSHKRISRKGLFITAKAFNKSR